jgi:hypothetical protein
MKDADVVRWAGQIMGYEWAGEVVSSKCLYVCGVSRMMVVGFDEDFACEIDEIDEIVLR